MGDYKEKHGKTRFGNFIKKASEIAPELLDAGIKLATGDVKGAISEVGDVLKSKANSDVKAKELLNEFESQKSDFLLDAFELEVNDREGARQMYKSDSLMQKAFGVIFLLGYVGLSWFLLDMLFSGAEVKPIANTLITTIWTGTSVKLNTIVDFFFGGSVKR